MARRSPATRGVATTATIVALLFCFVGFCAAASYDYYPGNPSDWVSDLAGKSLQPGDVVTFHAASGSTSATYDMGGYGSTFTWTGSQESPIVVRANPGHTITFTQSVSNKNTWQLAGQYWVFEGFEIIGTSGVTGGLPLRLMDSTNDVVVQDLKVHDLYDNAVTANMGGADYSNITFRRLEIWNTAGTGECFYAGCQATDSTTVPCKFHDSLFENNYCHDTCLGMGSTTCTGGSQGSGIQVKFGSYRNIIRNNVCKNTQTPCILLYDDWDQGVNLVEGNLIINTRTDSGIQVSAGAIIRNNVIVGSAGDGVSISNNPDNIYNNQGTRNIKLHHNTLVSNSGYGVGYSVVPSNSEFINNVAIGNSNGAYRDNVDMSSITWKRNGYDSVAPTTQTNGTFEVAGTLSTEFVNAGSWNLYPKNGGSLAGAGSNDLLLAYDFNGFPRPCDAITVGAYEKTSTNNPGWTPAASIKPINAGSLPTCDYGSDCRADCASPFNGATGGDDSGAPGPSGNASNVGPSSVLVLFLVLCIALLTSM